MFKATDFPLTMIVTFWDNASPSAPKSGLTVTGDIWDSRTGTLLWDNLSMTASANDAGAYVATITQAMYTALSAGNKAIFDASILVCTATASVTTGLARTTERAWVAVGLGGVAYLDAAVSSRLATAGYTAPPAADVTAIRAKTDQLVFAGGKVNANAEIDGSGLATQTSLDAALADLAILKARLIAGPIVYTGPINTETGAITLVRGAAYGVSAADGYAALTWTTAAWVGIAFTAAALEINGTSYAGTWTAGTGTMSLVLHSTDTAAMPEGAGALVLTIDQNDAIRVPVTVAFAQ